MYGYNGDGWYTVELYRDGEPLTPSNPQAEWIDTVTEFEDIAAQAERDGLEPVFTYYGDGDLPDDEELRVAERFIAAFTPEQARAYAARFDQEG